MGEIRGGVRGGGKGGEVSDLTCHEQVALQCIGTDNTGSLEGNLQRGTSRTENDLVGKGNALCEDSVVCRQS